MAQVPATRSNPGGRLAAQREHPLQQLRRDFDALFGQLWGGGLTPFNQDREPIRLWDFDVKENDKEIVVRAEMPGFEENELDVQFSDNVLTIKAEKEQKGDQEEAYRSFYRSITMPPGVNADKAQATYQNGVLELHIPRAEGAQPRRIKVQGQQAAPAQPEQPASSKQAGNPRQQAPNQARAPEKASK